MLGPARARRQCNFKLGSLQEVGGLSHAVPSNPCTDASDKAVSPVLLGRGGQNVRPAAEAEEKEPVGMQVTGGATQKLWAFLWITNESWDMGHDN